MNFTPTDLAMFKKIGVSESTLTLAQVRRVTHVEARDLCGIRYKSDHLEGIAFPYLNPEDGRVLAWRVRRDHCEMENGEPVAKYVADAGRKHLYFAPSCYAHLSDTSVTAIIVESAKSVLAIIDAEVRANRRQVLAIATDGCWGFKGVIGKTTRERGARQRKGRTP